MLNALVAALAFGPSAMATTALAIPSISASPGETVVVSVLMDNDQDVGGWQLAVHYDPSVMLLGCHPAGFESELGDCSNGDDDDLDGDADCDDMGCIVVQGQYGSDMSLSASSQPIAGPNGSYNVMALAFDFGTGGLSPGEGELMSIAFNVAANATPGFYDLSIKNAIVSTPSAQSIPLEILDGVIEVVAESIDADGDGFLDDEDCNDQDPAIYPGAVEICDGFDNDCDEETDEELLVEFYLDADGDGYGDAGESVMACAAPEGYVSDATDCDDSSSLINPGMSEEPGNDVDEDCDGVADPEAAVEPSGEPAEPAGEPSSDSVDSDEANSKAGACSQVGAADLGLCLLGFGLLLLRRRD